MPLEVQRSSTAVVPRNTVERLLCYRSLPRGAVVAAAEHWTLDQPEGGVEAWQDLLTETHLPWQVELPRQEAGGNFAARARRWWIDDLALVDCACSPCSGSRRLPEVAATEGDFVVLLMTLAGGETVEQGRARVELQAGDAVLWDSTVPARFAVPEPLQKRSLLIPRSALAEAGGRAGFDLGTPLDGRAPAMRLLWTYLDSLSQVLPELDSSAVIGARNATLDLLLGAVCPDGPVPTDGSARTALRTAMDRWIDRHLLGQEISPAAVAAAHGVSIRTVNRVFEATGETFGEAVRTRRLARARGDLAETMDPITSIAHRWGFADGSHFTRCFKAVYGCAPRDYRHGVIRPATCRSGPSRPASSF
jgi:AraC family transcriptional regulator, positive regulator of tynA and feaB